MLFQVGKLHTPYPTSRHGDDLHFTYLDTIGRPVISISNIGDLTEKHIQDFQLEFDYPKTTMVREPLILIAAFFLFFLLTIVYVRLDFAITKDVGYARDFSSILFFSIIFLVCFLRRSEARMKVAGVCEKVMSHQEKRNNSYSQFEDALSKYKTSRDNAAFSSTSKKIASDLKTETQAISDLIPSLKVISADTSEKVGDLQKFDRYDEHIFNIYVARFVLHIFLVSIFRALREHQASQVVLVDKLVGNKLQKPQFVEQEAVLIKKKDESREKMAQIMSQLRAF